MGIRFTLFGKISLGSDLSGIFFQERGLFSRLSFTNSFTESHKVYFGNEYERHICSCYDWGRTCSFVVFEKFPSCSINGLSLIYINSPFLKLGKTVIPLLKESTLPDAAPSKKQNEIVSNLEEPDEINEIMANNFQPLPSQDRGKTTTAANLL